MDERSITRPGPESPKQEQAWPKHPALPDFHLRGLGLVAVAAEEILESYQGGGRFLVPSGSAPDRRYEVRVGTRPERNRCECRGFGSHGRCSHVVAASRVAKASALCDSCGKRRWDHDLIQVTEDDESLTWFVGDLLCRGCVVAHGGIS